MFIRIVLIVLLVVVLTCAIFVRSENGLDYTPICYTMYKYEKYDVFRRAHGQQFQVEWNKQHPDRPIRMFCEPIGVIQILVTSEASIHRLAQQGDHRVLDVRARARVVKDVFSYRRQAEHLVEFPVGWQPGVRGRLGAMEFALQLTIEPHPKTAGFSLTHRLLPPEWLKRPRNTPYA